MNELNSGTNKLQIVQQKQRQNQQTISQLENKKSKLWGKQMKKLKFTFMFILISILAFMSGSAYAYDKNITLTTDRSSNVATDAVYGSWWHAVDNSKSTQSLTVEIEMYGPANDYSTSGKLVFKNTVPAKTIRVYLYNVFTPWLDNSCEVTEMGYFDVGADKVINTSKGYGTLAVIAMGEHIDPGKCTGHKPYSYADYDGNVGLTSQFKISGITSSNLLSGSWQQNYFKRVGNISGPSTWGGISTVASFKNTLCNGKDSKLLYHTCANYKPWYMTESAASVVSASCDGMATPGYPLGRCVIRYNNPVNDIVENFQVVRTGTKYSTLQEAIAGANAGDTIKVIATDFNDTSNAVVNKNIKIDMNENNFRKQTSPITVNSGCTLTIAGTGQLGGGDACHVITNNGTVTVNSGASVRNASALERYSAINNLGTLNVNGGTISSAFITIINSGTVNVNSGKVEAIGKDGGVDGWMRAIQTKINSKTIINGGTVIAENPHTTTTRGVRTIGASGSITVTGGNITGEGYSAVALEIYDTSNALSANLNISGSPTISAISNRAGGIVRAVSTEGSGVIINVPISISGGNISATSPTGDIAKGLHVRGNSATTQVTGGTIKGDGRGIFVDSNCGKLTIGNSANDLSKTNPLISGGAVGVEVLGEFNFYNGIIKGTDTTPYTGTVTPRNGCFVKKAGPEGGIYSAFLADSDITKATVTLTPTTYVYDGTAKTPSVAVKLDGDLLIKGVDYSVSYSNNTNVGTATATITGIGNYTGTKIATFTITGNIKITGTNKGGEILSADTSVLSPAGYTFTYQWYSNTTNSTSGGAPISGASSSTYQIKEGLVGRYIYVEVTASKAGYTTTTFSDITDSTNNVRAKVWVSKKLSDITDATENESATAIGNSLTIPTLKGTYTYNGLAQTASLNDYDSTKMNITNNTRTDAGTQTITVSIKDKTSYKWSDGTTTDKTISWTINPKSVAVTWGTTVSFVYTGSAQAPTATATSGVTGETINITRTTGTNVGSYTSTASISSVTGGQAKASNYTLTGATKAFTITNASLGGSIKITGTNTYGRTLTANTSSVTPAGCTFTYQWWYSTSSTATSGTNISGATGSTFVINSTTYTGKYIGCTVVASKANYANQTYTDITDAATNSTATVKDASGPEVTIDYNGTSLHTDPTFASGVNGTKVYNNTGNGLVTVTRVANLSVPTDSGYALHIKTTGTASPGHGGFYFADATAANQILVTKIIAKIPTGYSITWASNATGTDRSGKWLTSTAGTGNWETYIYYLRTGTTGSFSSTNFFYLTGGSTATETAPIEWDVAYAASYKNSLANYTNGNITLTGNATDKSSGTVAYAFTTSDTTPTTWTTVTSTTNTVSAPYTATANGTYFFWAKDANGNISKTATYVESIDKAAPTIVVSNITYPANASIKLTDTLSGTSYWAVTNSTTAPSTTQSTNATTGSILNTWYPVANTISEVSVTFTGLSAGTYYAWGKDAVGNQTSKAFTVANAAMGGSIKITGTAKYGQTLTADTSAITPADCTLTYQWYSNTANSTTGGTTISGATGSTYTVGTGLVGKYIYVVVTASKANYTTKTYTDITDATANGSATVTKVSLTKPTISGTYTYNGTTQTVTINNFATATMTVSGNTRIDAGTQNATVSLKDTANYEWADGTTTALTLSWTIAKKSVAVSWGTTVSFVYNGSAQAPTATATSGVTGETLNITRTTGTNIGNYTSTASISSVTGGQAKATNYTLTSTTKAFEITAKSVSGATVTLNPSTYTYDGTAKTPTATVVVGTVTLIKGTDYTVSYSNNTNVGTATVTITGTGNYSGTATTDFTITKQKLTKPTISGTYTYSGATQTATLNNFNSATMTVSGNTRIDAGTQTVTIKLKDTANYAWADNTITDVTLSFTIAKKSVATVWSNTILTYTGTSKAPTATVASGVTGETITLTVAGAQTNVGDNYTATASISSVTGGRANANNYTLTNTTTSFKIVPDTGITMNVTLNNNSYVYDGTAKAPTPTVKVGSTTLTAGTDYDVTYTNNKDAGTATVTITGKGNYAGAETTINFTITKKTLTVTPNSNQSKVFGAADPTLAYTSTGNVTGETPKFTGTLTRVAGENVGNYLINKGSLALADNGTFKANNYTLTVVNTVNFAITAKTVSGLTVTLNPSTYVYDGTAKTPTATIVDGGKNLVLNTDYTVTYKNNTNAGIATATITGKGNYSGTKDVTFTITNAQITGSITVTGNNKVGETLTANTSSIVPTGCTLTYQWYSNTANSTTGGIAISGATSSTYTIERALVGKYIYVIVTATKTNYDTKTFTDITDSTNNGSAVVIERDTTPPVIKSLTLDPTGWTKGNVKILLTATDDDSGIDGYTWSYWTPGTSYTAITPSTNVSGLAIATVSINRSPITVKIKDQAGNTAQATINVNNIDKTEPIISNGASHTAQEYYNKASSGTALDVTPGFTSTPNSYRGGTLAVGTYDGAANTLKITHPVSGTESGYARVHYYDVSKVYVRKIVAKIPVGYTLNIVGNAINGTKTNITSFAGTGAYTEYSYVFVSNNTTNNNMDYGHAYISGAAPSTAFDWYIRSDVTYDVTHVFDNVTTTYGSALGATIKIDALDYQSGVSSIKVNNVEQTLTAITNGKSASYLVSAAGTYTIVATDVLGQSTTLTKNAYQITYNSNGATSGSTTNQIKIQDANITLRANGFARTGYTFKGWNTAANGSGTNYAAGATYTGNANATLYAQWEAGTPSIAIDEISTSNAKWSGWKYTNSAAVQADGTVLLPAGSDGTAGGCMEKWFLVDETKWTLGINFTATNNTTKTGVLVHSNYYDENFNEVTSQNSYSGNGWAISTSYGNYSYNTWTGYDGYGPGVKYVKIRICWDATYSESPIKLSEVTFSSGMDETYTGARVQVTPTAGTISSVKYLWSKSASGVTASQVTSTMTNGTVVYPTFGAKGTYYLWILATNSEGKSTLKRSEPMIIDNPEIEIAEISKNPGTSKTISTVIFNQENVKPYSQGVGGVTRGQTTSDSYVSGPQAQTENAPSRFYGSTAYLLTKTGTNTQWHGAQPSVSLFNGMPANTYLLVSSNYKTTAPAGISKFAGDVVYKPDWSGTYPTSAINNNLVIEADGNEHHTYYLTRINEAITGNAIIGSGMPNWGYTTNTGSMTVDGIQWFVYTDQNEGISVKKYAAGVQPITYFRNSGTTFTGNDFTVTKNGTYTIYTKTTNGVERVRTVSVTGIDTTAPTIEVPNVTYPANASIKLTDTESGISYWAVTNSIAAPSTTQSTNATTGSILNTWYPVINTTSAVTSTFTGLSAGTYYAWGKDAAGNQTSKAFTVADAALGGSVKITGTAKYGENLTADTSAITPAGCTFTYQWYSNTANSTTGGTAISGATSQTYTVGTGLVGKYIYVVVTASKTNYTTKTYTDITDMAANGSATVTKVSLTKPTISGTYTYNGTEQTVSLSNFATATMNVSGNKRTDAGTQDAIVSLKDTANYEWADGTTTALTLSWTIAKKSVAVSWGTTVSFVYNGSAQAPTATATSGVTGETLNITRTTGTNIGNYTSTASISSVTGGQAKVDNYTLTGTTKAFEITAKSVSGATITLNPTTYVYDGTAKTPAATVVVGTVTLTKGTDYTVSYSNNTNVGTATVTITGTGNYSGAATKDFTITKQKLTKPTISGTYTYSGSTQTATLTGFDSATMTVTNNTRIDAGTQTVTIKLKDTANYAWSDSTIADVTLDWTIAKKSVATVWSNTILTYTGTSQAPTATVASGVTGETITLTVSGAQTNVGDNYTATASISSVTGGQANANNYTLTNTTTSFKIVPDIGVTMNVTLDKNTFEYDGTAHTPTPTVKVGGTTLTSGTDYDVTYTNNKDAGTSTVTITGKGNYAGNETTINFTITKKTLTVTPNANQSKVFGAADPTLAYTSTGNVTGETPKFTGTLARAAGENVGNYLINSGSLALADNGTFKASNYTLTVVNTVNFAITAKTVSGLTVTLTPSTYVYDGTAKTPTATIVDGGKELVLNTDYTITYKNNTNAGTATATITGKGNYSGTKDVTFTISKATLSVTSNDYTGTYDGTSHGITLSGTGITGATISYGTTAGSYTETIAPTYIDAGTYTVYFKVSKANYNDYTDSATVTINKKSVAVVWSNTSLGFNGTSQVPTATVASGVTGETINLSVSGAQTNVGTYTATASISSVTGGQAKASNYTLTGETTTFTISNAELVGSIKITGTAKYGETLTADTSAITPAGCTFTYQWYSNTANSTTGGTAISGETNSTYTVGSGLVGKYIYVVVTASKTNYADKTYTDITDIAANGSATVTKISLTKPTISGTYTYNGAEQTVSLSNFATATMNVSGNKRTDAGTQDAIVSLKDTANYEWSDKTTAALNLSWTIAKKIVSVSWGTTVSFVYNGSAQAPTATATSGVTGETINITRTTGINVGNYTSTASISSVTGGQAKVDNYTLTSTTKDFTITAKSVSGAIITLNPTTYVYDGTQKQPATEVIVDGITLTKGTDYTVSYSNNINVGIATVTITGKGNYSETKDVTFTITKATPILTAPSDQTLMANSTTSVSYTYNGDGTVTVSSSATSIATVTVDETTKTITITGVAAGTATITIDAAESNYNAATKTFTVTVKAANYSVNGVYYETLEEAYASIASSGTIKVEASNTDSSTLEIESGKTIIIDTNGKTITKTSTRIDNAGNLTIKGTGTIQTDVLEKNTISDLIVNVGTLTVENGTICNQGIPSGHWWAIFAEAGTVNINGGTIKSTGDINEAGKTARALGTHSGIINITDGTITSRFCVTTWGTDGTGEINISGGTLTADADVIMATGDGVATSITVTGGTLVSKKNYAIQNGGTGLVTIGVKDGDVSIDSPVLQAVGTAIKSPSIEFYDGILKSTLTVHEGDVITETGYNIYADTEIIDGVTYKTEVLKKNIDIATVDAILDQTYTGTAISPEPVVTYDGTTLIKETDYTITYTNNTNVGTATITITGIGGYTGTKTAEWKIIPKQIAVVWNAPLSFVYDGVSHLPTATAPSGVTGEEIVLNIATPKTDVGDYTATATISSVTGGNAKVTNYQLTNITTTFSIIPNADVEFKVTLDNETFIWNGTAHTPTPTVKVTLNGVEHTLEKDKDYTVSYKNNIEPGAPGDATAPTVIITGIKNYAENGAEKEFTIDKADRVVNVVMPNYQYASTLPTPTLNNNVELGTVTYYFNTTNSNVGGTAWSTVTDAKTLNVGTYYMYATITETAHYKAKTTIATAFNVVGAPAKHPTVEDKIYNAKLQVGVFGEEGIILTGITKATDVGTYTAYEELAPNYYWPAGDGPKEHTWTISTCDINDVTIKLNPQNFVYDGNPKEPTIIATLGDFVLTKNNDYTVIFKNNTMAGTATAVIKGVGNFSGEISLNYTIDEAIISKLEIDRNEFYYTGESIKPFETVYDSNGNVLVKDRDYIVYYEDNIEIGRATISVIGIENYKGTLETNFDIIGETIAKSVVTIKGAPFIYDGTEKKPEVEVVITGKTLVKGKDYEVTYENNINAGENTAKVIVTGKGKYMGSIEKTFTITKATRKVIMAPGKALILGTTEKLEYSYQGEEATTVVTINDASIATATAKTYSSKDFIEFKGLKVGRTEFTFKIAETQNYYETVVNAEVTVFANEEETYAIYGSVIINDDEPYTVTPKTILTLNVDFGDYMYISESNVAPALDAKGWYEFSRKAPYVFSDVEGEKVIYVWFKDDKGNMSKIAIDDIILDYTVDIPAHDNVMLDKTEISKTAPDVENAGYFNNSLDMNLKCNQSDVMINGVRSGIDETTIRYGYKEVGAATYTWQTSSTIKGLSYNKTYAFVTQAYDRAGNGVTTSDETIIQTERRYEAVITLADKNAQYDGKTQTIDEAEITIVNDVEITGNIVYTYYIDKACTILTNKTRDGAANSGGAPSVPGIYYVTASLTDDLVYYDVTSNVAELRIGWNISKTPEDDVFAYVERTTDDNSEYILKVIGEGKIIDLSDLLLKNSDETLVYWGDYKDKIVGLDLENKNKNTISTIGSEIFSDLTKITQITIPDTVTKIGDSAFEGCTNVNTNIKIPMAVEEIGTGAFAHVNTPAFEVGYGNANYDAIDGVLVDSNHEKLVAYPNGKSDEKYKIPDTVKTINESAFTGSNNLKDVVIPNGVETIEGKAFYDCPNLVIVEVEDLLDPKDNVIDLKTVGSKAFENIGKGSIIYTFSENVANKFKEEKTYVEADTQIYWPPVITLQPIDMNGVIGKTIKFIVEAKAGNPAAIQYQWFKVKDGVETKITGANSNVYITSALTASDDGAEYYCRVYNVQYYYDRGFTNSEKAKVTMLETANYIVERGTYNTYLFETLQDSFNFAITDDVIKPLQTVNNEAEATLKGNKSVKLDLNTYNIHLAESIKLEKGSALTVVGAGTLSKNGDYVFENNGTLELNGTFSIVNTTGSGIKTLDGSKLVFTSGTISVDNNAINAKNATVQINGTNAIVSASTTNDKANAISLYGSTNFNMTAGNISVAFTSEIPDGALYGIYVEGDQSAVTNIFGGTITATSTKGTADGIANAGKSDVVIKEPANISGSRSGIITLSSNNYGDIIVQSGKVSGGIYGILNNAHIAKIVIGKEGDGVSTSAPVVVGEKVAIFNAKAKNTLEFYDGILYSHSTNVIYEELNNTDLVISATHPDPVYRETGRDYIKTERKYSIFVEENVSYNSSTYKAAYLKEDKEPTVSDIEDQTVEVGEKGTFEVIVSGGQPDHYEYQWQVSTDGGHTWVNLTVGSGINSNKYTTPIVSETMDGYKYRCIISNEKMTIISGTANLNVINLDELANQRPIIRILFTDGRVITSESGKKFVNMQIVVKSFEELKSLKVNGKEIFGLDEYNFTDGTIEITKDANSPIEIKKTIKDEEKVVEYTYTYNMKVYANGIITVDAVDAGGRDNTMTQTVDLFYDLKVQYYLSDLTATRNKLIITFYANKPVKPTKSVTNSYSNSKYIDLVSVDGEEYSYRYNLELDEALAETEFFFEDVYHNETSVTVSEIQRVRYQNIKFNTGTLAIEDLNIIDAYNMAQKLESITEVNSNEEIQTRYGLNSVQSDIYMSRARDLGAADILNTSTQGKSYDGIFTKTITQVVTGGKDNAYDYKEVAGNLFVAAAAKNSIDNEFTKENGKYVDIISKDLTLYKGMNITGFMLNDSAPYMYIDKGGASNIDATTIAKAGFRATIISK